MGGWQQSYCMEKRRWSMGMPATKALRSGEEMAGPEMDCRIAMGAGKHRHLPDDGEGAVHGG